MCQPGNPRPHGLSHCMMCFGSCFQSAKSSGARFSGLISTRAPARRSSIVFPLRRPYSGNVETS